MLRQELQSYLDTAYPGSTIDAIYSVFGPVHIRFELGGTLQNGTQERVQQATDRALTLFNETFPDAERIIWVLFYEDTFHGESNGYLRELLHVDGRFYDEVGESDKDGQTQQRVVIGKLPVRNINAASIFSGIANAEMGFEPCINQRVYFINPASDRAFLMYDDRGCYVWSNEAHKIETLYKKYNHWIVDYHRPQIDAYFK